MYISYNECNKYTMIKQINNQGFLRVAAAVPKLRIGDPDFNAGEIIKFLKKAEKEKVSLVVFPEMSLPGYTVGDLYFQNKLHESNTIALARLLRESKNLKPVFIIGMPVRDEGKIFNTAVLIYNGKILGIVPKTYIPGYKEFYEERWFASGRDFLKKEISLLGQKIPMGTDLLFKIGDSENAVLGIEICEDLWAPLPPSSFQVLRGATIIANPSASNELVGKADYRRLLISQQSARGVSGYIYSSSGVHESTTDVVFGGHAVIAENGSILAESERFKREGEMIISEIDLERLASDRERMTSFGESIHESPKKDFRFVNVPFKSLLLNSLTRKIDPAPFVPQNTAERDKRAKEIFSIQVSGLAKRLEYSKIEKLILGLSGGLDSTLALLVAVRTVDELKISRKDILCFGLPGFGTSKRTKSNARFLAQALGVNMEEINISPGVLQLFQDIKHNPKIQNSVYENAQARFRTLELMSKANQIKGLVIGTGDLSEIALGWNTYTGDHIAHYNVNCSIPKTLVRYLVKWAADTQFDSKTKKILDDILATPISPELRKAKNGKDFQETEKLIGPYELHDFFLYQFLRWGSAPRKILFLAKIAWGNKYSDRELKKWLKVFLKRFFKNQWKRSVATDGPKVGSVSLSPRGDWRMPSDGEVTIWLKDLEE